MEDFTLPNENGDNSNSSKNENVEKEIEKSLAAVLEKLENLQEDPHALQQKPVSSSFLSEKNVETKVKNEPEEESDQEEEDLSEFRAWVHQQFSAWFDEDVLLPEEEVEEEEDEEEDEQPTPSVAELLIDDFFSETNIPTTSVKQPIFSSVSSVFCDPEFCELFRQASYSPRSQSPLEEQELVSLVSENPEEIEEKDEIEKDENPDELKEVENSDGTEKVENEDEIDQGPPKKCVLCPSTEHNSARCPTYSTIVDRIYRVIHDLKGCTACLSTEHMRPQCPLIEEIVCESCGLAHAEMLFHDRLMCDSDE